MDHVSEARHVPDAGKPLVGSERKTLLPPYETD